MLLLVFTGCSPSGPDPSTSALPTPQVTHWEMVGAVGVKATKYPAPPPFEGGRKLTEECRERRPCAAERWRSEERVIMDMVLIERTYHFADGRTPWPAQWVGITGTLRACIGDPLSVPPTDDPQSVRTLMTSKATTEWWLHFSGNNTCGLEGIIRLDANGPDVDLSGLRCEGKRWQEGGRECARGRLVKAKPR